MPHAAGLCAKWTDTRPRMHCRASPQDSCGRKYASSPRTGWASAALLPPGASAAGKPRPLEERAAARANAAPHPPEAPSETLASVGGRALDPFSPPTQVRSAFQGAFLPSTRRARRVEAFDVLDLRKGRRETVRPRAGCPTRASGSAFSARKQSRRPRRLCSLAEATCSTLHFTKNWVQKRSLTVSHCFAVGIFCGNLVRV
jgi:hypothetical protein